MPRLLSDDEVMALPPKRRLLSDDDLAGELTSRGHAVPPEPSLRDLNLRHGAPIPPTVIPGRRTAADVAATVDPRLLAAGRGSATNLAVQSLAGGAGATIGGPLYRATSGLARWLSRGVKTRPTAAATLPEITTAAKRPLMRDIAGEVANAGMVATAIDLGPELTPGEDIAPEWGEDTVALGGALATLAVSNRRLLTQHPRFRAWALRASRGRAGLGALVGIALSETPEVAGAIRELIDHLEATPAEEPPQRRTSVGPAAIPPPQWGHRPMPGGVGPVAPQPTTRTRRW
jgi:hypothetical protein